MVSLTHLQRSALGAVRHARSCARSRRSAIAYAADRGFTLVELCVTVAIVAILAQAAIPSLADFMTARRSEAAARRLGDDLAFARNEAIKRNAPVLLCPNAAVTDSTCTARLASDWSAGWRVCVDLDGDDTCDAPMAGDANPIRVQTIEATGLALTGPVSILRFNPNGSVAAASFVGFDVAIASGLAARWSVRYAASGAIRVRKG